jgi:hypothetical protein
MFPIRNGLKQGDALDPLLFNFALDYAIKRVQVNQDSLQLNGIHHLLAYADDINILGGSVHTVKENEKALVAATKKIGLEVNADKTKYIVMSQDQNTGQNHSMKIEILPVVLCGCETWSLTLREEHRLSVSENSVLRRVFGAKRYEATEEWRKLHNEEKNDLYSLPNIVRVVKSRKMIWAGHMARHRWDDNIKMDLQDVGGSRGDWLELAQDRDRWWTHVSMLKNLRVP